MLYSVFILLRTNAPAPMVTLSQIVMPPITLLPNNIVTLLPITETLSCVCPTLQFTEILKFPQSYNDHLCPKHPCHASNNIPNQTKYKSLLNSLFIYSTSHNIVNSCYYRFTYKAKYLIRTPLHQRFSHIAQM